MANTTMTKVQKFNAIAKAVEGMTFEGFDVQEFLAHEVELISNKKRSGKPTKTQKENAEKLPVVLEALASIGEPTTVTDLIKSGLVGEISTQKATALLKMLKAEGKIDTVKEKGKNLYFIPSESAEEVEEIPTEE